MIPPRSPCSGRPAAAGAAQHRAHPQGQFPRAERLGHVVVRAGLEADQAVGLVAQGGQHHDRDRPAGAQPAAHLQAVHAGQHQVEDDQVGRLLGDPAQRLVPVVHALDRMAVADEVPADDVGDGGIVVHDEDPSRWIRVTYQGCPPCVPRHCHATR